MSVESFFEQISLALISTAANFLSAFSGGGAGLIQLPALILFGLPFPIALATHKLASVALGIGAGLRHIRAKSLTTKLSIIILLFGLPGVFLGSSFVLSLPSNISTTFLGIFTLFLGAYSYLNPTLGSNKLVIKSSLSRNIIGGIVLFFIGFLNGSLSSGTGLFVTIWLVRWFSLPYTKAIAFTLILVGFVWNGTGALIVGSQSDVMWSWIPALLIGSFTGGYIGAHFSLIKGDKMVKSSFEAISILMGLLLLFQGL